MKDVRTTQQDVSEEVGRLEPDYRTQEVHKTILTYDNFLDIPFERDTGRPEKGYGSVLPRHPPDHRKSYMVTTHSVDYKYPFEWTPKDFSVSLKHLLSLFLDIFNLLLLCYYRKTLRSLLDFIGHAQSLLTMMDTKEPESILSETAMLTSYRL